MLTPEDKEWIIGTINEVRAKDIRRSLDPPPLPTLREADSRARTRGEDCEDVMKRVISYGGGVDSTAMTIQLLKKAEPIDLIIFADTGG
ncbi:MAG: hypothetical protein ACRD6W_05670, partial [Nitrososphaerales archaeon]